MDNPAQNNTQNTLSEYESLKNKNRRRLIGAGAITLLISGLFSIMTHGNDKQVPTTKQPAPKTIETKTDVLRPNGLQNNIQTIAASTTNITASSTAISANSLLEDEINAEPDSNNTQLLKTQSESERQLLDMTSPLPLSKPSDNEQLSPAQLRQQQREMQRLAKEQRRAEQQRLREEAKQKREQERRERELAKQKAERERIAKAREDEIKRKKAQAIAAQAEAEREARRKEAAEKARQAQIAADNARKAEREKLLQQRTQNENHKSSPTLPNNVITKNNTDKGGKALVQVGAFRDPNLAKAAQQKLKKLNLSYTVDELNTRKGKIYRIRTGSFATRAAAEAAAERIKAQGLAGLIIEQK